MNACFRRAVGSQIVTFFWVMAISCVAFSLCAGSALPGERSQNTKHEIAGIFASEIQSAQTAQPQNSDEPKLRLPAIWSNNMLIQRGKPICVWGWSSANKEIHLVLTNDAKMTVTVTTKSDSDGNWKFIFPEIDEPSGAIFTLSVSSGTEKLQVNNIIIGDVWLASGQSNMAFLLSGATDGDKAAKDTADSDGKKRYDNLIRYFRINSQPSFIPQDDVDGKWVVCDPKTAPNFSAVGFYFARDIADRYHIPVGLIDSAWGGMPAESYTSIEQLQSTPGLDKYASQFKKVVEERKYVTPEIRKNSKDRWKTYCNAISDLKAAVKGDVPSECIQYTTSEFDDSSWKLIKLPSKIEDAKVGLDNFDGVVWFRKTITIPDTWVNRDLVLCAGYIDDADITFVNGTQVGRTNQWKEMRTYSIPASVNNSNTIAISIRCVDIGGGGGVCAGPLTLSLKNTVNKENALNISGEWRFAIDPSLVLVPKPERTPGEIFPSLSSTLFNARIAPLIKFPVCGAIWYQGEANVSDAEAYRVLFPAMIKDWRQRYGYDFPFYWVQLANFLYRSSQPRESHWAQLRDAQTMTRQLPLTGEAVTIDIGESNDIHPRNKLDVGLRLALWARRDVYGEKINPSSAMLNSYTLVDGKVVLQFLNTGEGLMVKGGEIPGGFAIAGADGKYIWAKATITGPSTIIVESDDVREPALIRYAWDDNPLANVFSRGNNLPVTPFTSTVVK